MDELLTALKDAFPGLEWKRWNPFGERHPAYLWRADVPGGYIVAGKDTDGGEIAIIGRDGLRGLSQGWGRDHAEGLDCFKRNLLLAGTVARAAEGVSDGK